MKAIIRVFIFGFIGFLAFTGCKDKHLSFKSDEEILISQPWMMESYVDHNSNTSLEVTESMYEFLEDGTFIVTPKDSISPQYTTWELLEKNRYLRLGNNIFKVKIISKKLLGLQYGYLDIYYIPYVE